VTKSELPTPSILVDRQILQNNINKFQAACNAHGKRLWPMLKTHKSTAIAQMQAAAGADGFLCGTLKECEALADAGFADITLMYAYPVATQPAIGRVIELSKRCNFVARVDSTESAELLSTAAFEEQFVIDCTIIVDSGLGRLGVPPDEVLPLANGLMKLPNLRLRGVSTHPGHVYAATSPSEVTRYVADEKRAMAQGLAALQAAGIEADLLTSGSTPTFMGAIDDEVINIYHPGNYVFNDAIQIALGVASEADCALTVLASVISRPRADLFIIDAGSKTFGLDAGAHGNAAVRGFGIIKGHPQLSVIALSEEVGKVAVAMQSGGTSLKIGDKIEIIPNHACVPASLAAELMLCEGDRVVDVFKTIGR